jgi:orotate phosphoribosyltransferase
MAEPSSARLLEFFCARALLFGKFTLASGKGSNYYVPLFTIRDFSIEPAAPDAG